MIPEDMRVLVAARVAQAREALADARFLLQSGRGFRSAVHRAYYGALYAVLGLLQTRGKTPRSHGGALALLSKEFVRSGEISKENDKRVHRLLETRLEDDYRRLDAVTREEASQALADAEQFVDAAEALLRVQGFLN